MINLLMLWLQYHITPNFYGLKKNCDIVFMNLAKLFESLNVCERNVRIIHKYYKFFTPQKFGAIRFIRLIHNGSCLTFFSLTLVTPGTLLAELVLVLLSLVVPLVLALVMLVLS